MAHLGQRIADLRGGYGYSPSQVAALAEIPKLRVEAIESGSVPSLLELTKLAKALVYDPALLVADHPPQSPSQSLARFRAPLGLHTLSGDDMRLLALGAQVGRVCADLCERLGRDPTPLAKSRHPCAPAATEPGKEGYALGQADRSKLLPTLAPIPSVQAWLESQGVHVAFVAFTSSEIEAASIYEVGKSPVILLNSQHARVTNRIARRAALSHELSHILHDGAGDRSLEVVSLEHARDPVEQRAGGYGPSFLAPGTWFYVDSTAPLAIVQELAVGWGLSFEGAVWHAKNLGRIRYEDAQRLLKEGAALSWPDSFEEPVRRLVPAQAGIEVAPSAITSGLAADLAVTACLKDLISPARAAEILSIR